MTAHMLIEDISVHRGPRKVLHDVSCEFVLGGCTAIIGPNGAGKTTLLKSILGLLPLSSGRIQIDGEDLHELDYARRAQCMAYVPQQSALQFPLAVRDVILQGRYSSFGHSLFARLPQDVQASIQEVMQQLDLVDLAERSFNQLSGGEQRRVLLARALVGGAQTLILDEPTAHLDFRHVLEMKQHISELQKLGKTVIMVLHDLQDAADITDDVMLMYEGRVHARGSLDSLGSDGVREDVFAVRIEKSEQYSFHAREVSDE